MWKRILLIILLCPTMSLLGQSVKDIQQDPSYLWGTGNGTTLKQADDKASEVLAKANQKAGELKEAVVNEAQERAEKRMETLKVKLKEEEGAFDADTQKEVDALRAIADQREAQAVEMILRELS